MPPPDVSVIVPVYNAMPYLVSCLSSVMEQTIGRDRVEVLAVDDGSTDGSGEQLDLLAMAWDRLRVFHQRHSGGPGRPRNVGLAHATGRYVFFLDADDYLAPEALQRMVALVEEHGSDAVVCRRERIGAGADQVRTGKPRRDGLSGDAFGHVLRRSQRVDVVAPLIFALSDCKHLFQRDQIMSLGIRFPEEVHLHEDTIFCANYLRESTTIAMVDDYICYYDRLRDDGENITTRFRGTETQLRGLGLTVRTQHGHPELRGLRDQITRSALTELTQQIFNDRFLRHEPEVRARMMDGAREMLETWLTPRAQKRIPALGRVKINLLRRGKEAELRELIRAETTGEWGKEIVRAGRVYGAYPYFGDAAVGVPDECYDVTNELPAHHHLTSVSLDRTRLRVVGHAYIERVDTVDVTTMFLLRERFGRAEQRWPTRPRPTPELSREHGRYDYGLAGFDVEIDLADVDGRALPAGRWSASLAIGAQGVTKVVPLGHGGAEPTDGRIQTRPPDLTDSPADFTVSAYFTKFDTLALDIGL